MVGWSLLIYFTLCLLYRTLTSAISKSVDQHFTGFNDTVAAGPTATTPPAKESTEIRVNQRTGDVSVRVNHSEGA